MTHDPMCPVNPDHGRYDQPILNGCHCVVIARVREDAYQKGRDHGWALNAECCGSCPGECAQRVALRQMKEEGLV